MMKKVAIVGTQGVPARYGGFETLVENIIGENCSPEIQYTVFCSSKDMPQKLTSYRGAALRYVPLHANGVQSIPYDILSMIKTVGHGFDAMLVLGTSGCMFLPILRLFFRKKIIVNIDGLEHRRAKWGKMAKRYLRMSEAVAVKMADVIVADNQGIAQYVKEKYGFQPSVIAYGGDHVLMNLSEERQRELLKTYGVEPGKYAVTVCRIEPENNSRMILETFAAQKDMKLVFVGNWEKSDYSRSLREEFGKYSHICLVNSEYNLDRLYALRSQCAFYIHGHSAGGTNPSLVETMWLGCPVLAYDVVYNRYTTGNRARYFHNSDELAALLQVSEAERKSIGRDLRQLAEEEYHWKRIAEQYEAEY